MTQTRSIITLQNTPVSHSASLEVEFLSSDSFDSESVVHSSSSKKRPSSSKKKNTKSFSNRPIVPGQVINPEQLEASHYTVSTFFRAKKLSLILRLGGLELFKELVRLFYLNLWISADSCVWETLILGNRIVLNNYLFKEVFGSHFSGDIPFMYGNVWPDQFEISLEDAKIFVAKIGSDLSNFGHLSIDSFVDLSEYMSVLIDATYDTHTFSSMRADTPKATRISVDYVALFLKEAEHIKVRLVGLETHMQVLQDTLGKVLQLHKDSSTDVGKLCLEVGGLKKDVIR
ncbi:hypothetical protein H5410_052372 [Solanum commersonii]|uniref:Uncharacterized protein n=1 Tax=Solanum commersonii TaxID=4109 RepID=A0A9J5X0N8_SOLCO|nr:hypothetical protein H5410_052372 [Solanum commersonii]